MKNKIKKNMILLLMTAVFSCSLVVNNEYISSYATETKATNYIVATNYKFTEGGKEYKLKGDGTNEAETLQLMFDSINKKYKGENVTIHFPAGNYHSNKRITVYSNMTITGVKGKTMFKNTARSPFFVNGITSHHPNYNKLKTEYKGNAGSNITIKDVTFNQSRAVSIGNGNNITLNNIHVIDCPNNHAIEISASKDITVKNSTFEGMNLKDSSETMKDRDYNEFIQIDVNSEKAFPHFGKYDDDKYQRVNTNITIDNCVFKKSKNNAFPVAVGTHGNLAGWKISFENVVIKNCTIDGATKGAIRFPLVTSITVKDNKISNTPVAFEYISEAKNNDVKKISITNNTFNNVSKGVHIEKKSGNAVIDKVSISNNTFKGKSSSSSIAINLLGSSKIKSIDLKDNKYSTFKYNACKEGKETNDGTFKKATVSSNGYNLNVRKGPGTNYTKIDSLKHGASVDVKKVSNDWAEIIYGNNKTGYVSAQYLNIKGTTISSTKTGVLTANGVRLRKGAGTNYGIITSLNKNTKVTILATSSKWYKVQYNNTTGYVCSDYIKIN